MRETLAGFECHCRCHPGLVSRQILTCPLLLEAVVRLQSSTTWANTFWYGLRTRVRFVEEDVGLCLWSNWLPKFSGHRSIAAERGHLPLGQILRCWEDCRIR